MCGASFPATLGTCVYTSSHRMHRQGAAWLDAVWAHDCRQGKGLEVIRLPIPDLLVSHDVRWRRERIKESLAFRCLLSGGGVGFRDRSRGAAEQATSGQVTGGIRTREGDEECHLILACGPWVSRNARRRQTTAWRTGWLGGCIDTDGRGCICRLQALAQRCR